MQITLGYSDVEAAMRNYVKTIGISKEVTEINFIQQRKPGAPVKVELTLDTAAPTPPPTGPTPRAVAKEAAPEADSTPEPVTEAEEVKAEAEESEPVSEPANLFGG